MCRMLENKVILGKIQWIERKAIVESLERLKDRRRPIVLVGHGLHFYLDLLEKLGFDASTSVIGLLDTQKLAARI